MVSIQKTGLMALITVGALFGSTTSFCGNDNSFDWPTTRYYTSAAVAGAVTPFISVGTGCIEGAPFISPIAHNMLKGNFRPTPKQETNAQFVRGTSCGLTVGALITKIPHRPTKFAAMIISGTFAGFLP